MACGQSDQALVHFRRALDLATAIEQEFDQARAHNGLGHAFRDLRDLGRAREHWERAVRLYQRMGVPEADRVRQALVELGEPREM